MKNKIGPATFRVSQVDDDPAKLIVNGIEIGELYGYSNKDILLEAVNNGQRYSKELGATKGIFVFCVVLTLAFGYGAVANGLYMHKLKTQADIADREVML